MGYFSTTTNKEMSMHSTSDKQTSVNAGCYCDETYDGECCICRDARERREEVAEAKSWSWNLSPRECAERAIELGWGLQTLTTAMKAAGFDSRNINAVVYEFEIGE